MRKRILTSLLSIVALALLGSLAYADLKPGTTAPGFTLPTLDGKTFSLSNSFDKPAKPVVLDIWATWCGPCKRGIPYLVDLHEEYKDKAVFVGVAVDANKSSVKNYVKQAGVNYVIPLDPNASKIGSSYKVESLPTMYIIDKKGVIRYVHKGFPVDKEAQKKEIAEIEKEIKKLAAE